MRSAQKEQVLVTRHGKPAVLIRGVEGEELEDLLTASDPAFWKMIEARRARHAARTSPPASCAAKRDAWGESPRRELPERHTASLPGVSIRGDRRTDARMERWPSSC
jgi:hypothetical protein